MLASKPTQPYKIGIFGEVLADVFPDRSVLGGAPYNVARHLKAFNEHPIVISRVGDDDLKTQLFHELEKLEMDMSGIQIDPSHPTGQVIVHMNPDHSHAFEIKPNQAYDHIHSGMTHLTVIATKPDFAYFGTLAQRNQESKSALDTFLMDTQCPRFLDVNLRAPWYDENILKQSLKYADIVKINDDELTTIYNIFDNTLQDDKERAIFLMNKFDIQQLFITYGKDGAFVLLNNGKEARTDASPLPGSLADTVGAGDAFAAVCILGILHEWQSHDILKRASDFASAICTIRGAAPDDANFYTPFVERWF